MPSHNTYHLTWVSLTLDVGYLFTAAPAKLSRCSLPWMRGISSPPPLLTLNIGVAPLGHTAPVQPPLLGRCFPGICLPGQLKKLVHLSCGISHTPGLAHCTPGVPVCTSLGPTVSQVSDCRHRLLRGKGSVGWSCPQTALPLM